MTLEAIRYYRKIIIEAYTEPEEGILLSQIWSIIELYNKDFTIQQKNSALVTIMEELLKKNLVKINKAFSKGEQKPYWQQGHRSYIQHLKKFLSTVAPEDLERNDPELTFVRLDYEFVEWQVESLSELKRILNLPNTI
ncbi:MAG: iron uptake system EfeUOB component EfeO/EfeM [Parvicella sp.]|jgi:iron uptake system EfeUOB component EfeO/EfeM